MTRSIPAGLGWLKALAPEEIAEFNPCVPGEFTLPTAYYVNTGTPNVFYGGTEEGTLPMVAGRWFLIPEDVVDRNPGIARDAVSVARAVRLTRAR